MDFGDLPDFEYEALEAGESRLLYFVHVDGSDDPVALLQSAPLLDDDPKSVPEFIAVRIPLAITTEANDEVVRLSIILAHAFAN